MLKIMEELRKNKSEYEKITIGYFDGVHKGHQALLNKLDPKKDLIITFSNNAKKDDIYPIEDKLLLLKQFCENIIILDLQVIKGNSKMKFINFLKEFNPQQIIVGKDFHFGHNRTGSIEDLKKYFNVCVVADVVNDKGKKISSTLIRKCLKEGKIEEANKYLTRYYRINDMVVNGSGIGHILGIPTINLLVNEVVLLKRGVYETRFIIDNKTYISLTNVGPRLTFDKTKDEIETHVLDFDKSIYGKIVSVEFLRYLRKEEKFPNPEALVVQIKKDIAAVKEYNNIK